MSMAHFKHLSESGPFVNQGTEPEVKVAQKEAKLANTAVEINVSMLS